MKIFKKIILCLTIIFTSLITITSVAGTIIYSSMFFHHVDVKIEYPYLRYEDSKYKFEERKYYKEDIMLEGYYLKNDSNKALIIFVHGFKDKAETLLPVELYFYEKGYSIFSFDSSGVGKSEGELNGFTEALIDLKYTLDYLDSDIEFKNQKKLLFGFSSGGFAVTSIFNFGTKNIYSSVSVSGYNESKNLIYEKGYSYVGILADIGRPVISFMEMLKFKNYYGYTAVGGINNTNLPIMIVHSKDDKIINYDKESIISKSDLITNKNVEYLSESGKNHLDIIYSNDAIEYQNKIKENKDNFDDIDVKLFNEIDINLFDKINNFYEHSLI